MPEVGNRTELSLRSLRHVEGVELVKPSGRTHGGFRLYAKSDVENILLTAACRSGAPSRFGRGMTSNMHRAEEARRAPE